MKNLRETLEQIREGASRSADKSVGDSKKPDELDDNVTADGGSGGSTSRSADKSTGDSTKPTKVSNPTSVDGTETKGEGSEVDTMPEAKDEPEAEVVAEKDETEVEAEVVAETETKTDELQAAKDKLAEESEFSVEAELGSLLESEGLSEEFKQKIVTVFEAAVNNAAEKHIEKINEHADEYFTQAVADHTAKLDEETDKYLSYVVNEWVEKNELAVSSGIRLENAESFMNGLKELMESHYIEIPESEESALEEALSTIEEVNGALTEQVNKNIELQEENKAVVGELKKELELEKFTRSMTVLEAEKIRELAKDLVFEGAEEFRSKLGVLKENYFPEKSHGSKGSADIITEDAGGDALVEDEDSKLTGSMAVYAAALGRLESTIRSKS